MKRANVTRMPAQRQTPKRERMKPEDKSRRPAKKQTPPNVARQKAKPKPKPKPTSNQSLPQAIDSNRLNHFGILANSRTTTNLNRRIRAAALIKNHRQITPNMPTLPKKNRHNADNGSTCCDLSSHSLRQTRRHKLKKRQRNRPSGLPAQLKQPGAQPLERLGPARISRAMRKQHHAMRSHIAS